MAATERVQIVHAAKLEVEKRVCAVFAQNTSGYRYLEPGNKGITHNRTWQVTFWPSSKSAPLLFVGALRRRGEKFHSPSLVFTVHPRTMTVPNRYTQPLIRIYETRDARDFCLFANVCSPGRQSTDIWQNMKISLINLLVVRVVKLLQITIQKSIRKTIVVEQM